MYETFVASSRCSWPQDEIRGVCAAVQANRTAIRHKCRLKCFLVVGRSIAPRSYEPCVGGPVIMNVQDALLGQMRLCEWLSMQLADCGEGHWRVWS